MRAFLLIALQMLIIVDCKWKDYKRMEWKVKPGMYRPNFTENGNKFFRNVNSKAIASRSVLQGVRREFRCMSTQERNNYTSALQNMKKTMVGNYAQYDHFQVRHSPVMAPNAHNSPSFYGWHREFLVRVENVMQSYCPNCMQPYWDNRLDARLGGDPGQSVYFSQHLMGNPVGPVTTGFAANWTFVGDPTCSKMSLTLQRNLTASSAHYFNDHKVNAMDYIKNFTELSSPWNTIWEDYHGYIHQLFGQNAHMNEALCSPLDPVFFQHHTFIDLLFERARQSMKKHKKLFYPTDPIMEITTRAKEIMPPFLITNEYAVIDDSYTRDIYMYATLPGSKRCIFDSDCCDTKNVEFLWCNVVKKECVSKVQEGGIIKTYFPHKACHCAIGKPRNNKGFCACV